MSGKSNLLSIIQTKLHRPQLQSGHLHRQQLLDRLSRNLYRPFTLISAPAGYGKSTLAACWVEACDIPGAWVSLDKKDNDFSQFLSYFIASVRSIFPDACEELRAITSATEIESTAVVASTLLNELDKIDGRFILVLDDYQFIHDKGVNALMTELVVHPPRNMHLVITTRRDPNLPLSALRAKGLMTEIRAQDLRLSLPAIGKFLKQNLKMEIDDKWVAAIEQRTEGWVTGLHLAVIFLRHQQDLKGAISRLSEDNRYVLDYFISEIISHQPPSMQEMLIRTSILDRFCASLCDAVCAENIGTETCEIEGERFLSILNQENLFSIPLDDEHTWFRYHHLFQSFIRRTLKHRVGSDEIRVLHGKAGHWFAKKGLVEEALDHFSKSREKAAAAQLVKQYRHVAMDQEQWHRLRAWLDALPLDTVENDPALLMVRAWLLIGWQEMIDVMEKIALKLNGKSMNSSEDRHLFGEFAVLQSLTSYHILDGKQALSYARDAMEKLPTGPNSIRGLAVMLEALSLQMVGDFNLASKTLYTALSKEGRQDTTYYGRVLLSFCFMNYMAADSGNVEQFANQCLKIGQEHNLHELAAHARYFMGLNHYERNETARAETFLASVVNSPYIVNTHNYAFSAFALALTYQARKMPRKAHEVVASIVRHALDTNNISLLQIAKAFQAELALRQNRIPEAVQWADSFNPEPFTVAYRFYVPQVTLAKFYLHRNGPNDLEKAEDLLARLNELFTACHNTRCLMEVLALQSLTQDAKGDAVSAMTSITSAIEMARPSRNIRFLVDLGPKMAALLKRLVNQNIATRYIGQILSVFQDEGIVAETAWENDRPLSDPLTQREIEVLGLLAPGLVNKEIAGKLCISPETVKKHTQHIYHKLNTSNRRQAVARAYEMGILKR